ALALAEDDDLAVEDVAAGEAQVGEVAAERLAIARLQEAVLAVDEDEGAEAVPLGLVGPAGALGQAGAWPGELRQHRRREWQRHLRSHSSRVCEDFSQGAGRTVDDP